MAYRSSSSQVTIDTTISIPAPSGIVDGDILIVFAVSDNASTTFTWPAGFTALPSSPLTCTFDAARFGAAIKVASGESGSYSVTGSNSCIGGMLCFSGRGTSATFSTGASTGSGSAASPWNIDATGDTAVSGDDLIFLGCSDNGSSGDVTHAAPSGFTQPLDLSNGAFFNICASYKENVSAGATGTITGTGTLSGSAATAAFLIALPAAGGSPPVLRALTLLGVG